MKHYEVIVVGGGPSGLTCSYYLKAHGISHLIIEKGEMLHTWKHERWDSFYLVTPNWMTNLPGFEEEIPYNNEYMSKQEILAVLDRYLKRVSPEYIENTTIQKLYKKDDHYCVDTDQGCLSASHIIVATGMYSHPFIPEVSKELPASIHQMHSSVYKNVDQLAEGNILVVGSGWSGIQIALEAKQKKVAEVYLSIGSMTPLPTLYKNVHGVYWLNRLSGYSKGKQVLSYRREDFSNHNIINKMSQNLKQCQQEGIHLLGRLLAFETHAFIFSNTVKKSLEDADVYLEHVKQQIEKLIQSEKLPVSEGDLDRYVNAVDRDAIPAITMLDITLNNITQVIWSTGFKRDYSWIARPIFDGSGLPILEDGVSTSENIYFCGLGLEVDSYLKSSFGVGLYAINESSERAVKAVLKNRA